jgi:hypothetical protein
MDDDRALRREAKREKRRHGMRVHGLRGAILARELAVRGEQRVSRAAGAAARGGGRERPRGR